MATAGWSRFWRRDQDKPMLSGAVTRATVRGESIEEMLEHAARGLLQVREVERAAVWLESPQDPNLYLGKVVEAGSEPVPEAWKRLNVSVPFFRTLLASEDLVVEDLGEKPGAPGIGPLAGMRRAAWIPLRLQQRTIGLLLAAYGHPRHPVDTESLRALADELTLAVALQRNRELHELWWSDLRTLRQLQRAILGSEPVKQILDRMTREAARQLHAEFLALARSNDGPLRFDFFEGPRGWAALLGEKPLSDVWQTAVREGRPTEVCREVLEGWRPRREFFREGNVSRVVALPLEAGGEGLGVLLAGLTPASAPVAELERLECYATLAALALREERRRALASHADTAYRALLESTGEWILIVDRSGVICEASRAAFEHLDLEPADLGRLRLEELFPDAAREAIVAWRASAWSAPAGIVGAPAEGVLPSGLTVRLHLRNGTPKLHRPEECWQVWVEDVTAPRAVEQKSGQFEAELLSVLDSVDSGVLLLDARGRIRVVNDRLAHMLGLDARRVAERGSVDALVEAVAGHFRDPQAFARHWRETLHGDESGWDELELVRPKRRVIERFARPVFDAEGRRIGWLEIYRDITNQRMIQSKMLQTEKMAALGQLVSGIAHELNNPLTSIMGYAQLLLGRRSGAERSADARRIYREAERAGRIVKNLLLFARETKPERRAVDLNEVVERTLALRGYELKVENITVELELDADLPTTLADASQLQQIVLNLVVNAEHAIQQGRGQGRIRVRTQRLSSERLALEVSDDGPGILPEIVSRVFDPFFTTKPVGVGTGLGLSIVYGIVQEHDGEVSVSSQPGRGATFLVELPVISSPAVEASGDEAPRKILPPLGAAAEPGQPAAARRDRILVVEDEPTVAQLITDVLGQEGYRIDSVLDSREGLDRLSRQEYDLVICDLKMPYLDGRAFYRALTRAGNPLQHRIVFVTGDTLAPRTLEFLENTGLPYLAKPFLVEELKLVVQRALGSAAPHLAAESESDVAASKPGGWPQDAASKP